MIFKAFREWRRRRTFEITWTQELFDGLKHFIGEERAKQLFKIRGMTAKIKYLENLRDEISKKKKL